jgi:hypothetical protein
MHGTSMKSGAARRGNGTTETVYQLERSHPETVPQYMIPNEPKEWPQALVVLA